MKRGLSFRAVWVFVAVVVATTVIFTASPAGAERPRGGRKAVGSAARPVSAPPKAIAPDRSANSAGSAEKSLASEEAAREVHPSSRRGRRLLHLAAERGDLEEVRKLLASGADIDELDETGYTPLMRAALRDRERIAKFLLERGADPSRRDRRGRSAADLAPRGGRVAQLAQFMKQVDAAAAAKAEAEAATEEGGVGPESESAAEERTAPRLTRLRLVGKPEGVWRRRRAVTLESIKVEVRNVGEETAHNVRVEALVPGGPRIDLKGPSQVLPRETAVYRAKYGQLVLEGGELDAAVTCENCRR